jgi:hypothetical protein
MHPGARPICHSCLTEHLQEFRHANVRAGLRLAGQRIGKLRGKYATMNGARLAPDVVAYDLGQLLSELETLDHQVMSLPVAAAIPLLKARGFTNV